MATETKRKAITPAQAQRWLDRQLEDPKWLAKLHEGQKQMLAQIAVTREAAAD